jgi:site-specific recombinase XerD
LLSIKAISSATIVDWYAEIILDTQETMDLIELTEAFLAAKCHGFSPNTRRAYRYDLVACARLLPTIPLTEITVSHLRLFLDATADLAPTTVARRKAALRSCFGWAYQQELLPADPSAKLEAILAAIPRHDLRNRLLVTLLYETAY